MTESCVTRLASAASDRGRRGPRADGRIGIFGLARRLVGLLGEDGDVERRVPRPGAEDAVVEVEAHHLRPNQGEVVLLRQREPRGVDRAESREPAGQGAGLRRHRPGS